MNLRIVDKKGTTEPKMVPRENKELAQNLGKIFRMLLKGQLSNPILVYIDESDNPCMAHLGEGDVYTTVALLHAALQSYTNDQLLPEVME